MKKIVLVFFTFITSISFAQTAEEYFNEGFEKHKQKDFEAAIAAYSKAIKADEKFADAYFNRGSCELALHKFDLSKADFSKTILLDPAYAKAYYARASVYVSEEKYTESLPDLDKVIALEPSLPNALTLRGQIRAQTGNKKGACDDFNQAAGYGDKNASKYLNQFCGNEQQSGESLMLDWPEKENWQQPRKPFDLCDGIDSHQ